MFTQLTVITPDGQFARRRCSRADLRSPGHDGGRHRRGRSTSSAPSGCWSSGRTASRSPMTRCCRPGNSSGTGWEMTSSTGPCTARSSPTRTRGTATAGTPPTCTGRAAGRHRRGHHPLAGRAHPLPPAARHRTGVPGAAHHAARRSTRRRRSAFAILALLTALAVAASGFAFSQRAAAVRQRDQASYNQVVAEALQFGTSDTTLAAQLTLAAYRIQPTQDLASRLVNTENTPLPSVPGGWRRVHYLGGVQPRRAHAGQRRC